MKKWFFLFTLCLYSFAFASPLLERTLDRVALWQLASALGIAEEEDPLEEIQKYWPRQPNQERWEMKELSIEQKQLVLNWATKQGLFSPWKPACKKYDKALILGATTSRMQMRLNYLKTLWEEGVRFEEIVWLTGDRPLDKRVDELTDRCNTESEAAHIIWEETSLPDEMSSLPVLFVAVPMKEGGRRPNTEDTLLAFLKTAPEPCKTLFVSDQPFCGYQFAVIHATLPNAFLFDLVGQGVDSSSHPAAAAMTLDAIARWIYQENLTPKSDL